MRRSTEWCAADPGSYQTRRLRRSRVCSASFRCAPCCAAPGKRCSLPSLARARSSPRRRGPSSAAPGKPAGFPLSREWAERAIRPTATIPGLSCSAKAEHPVNAAGAVNTGSSAGACHRAGHFGRTRWRMMTAKCVDAHAMV